MCARRRVGSVEHAAHLVVLGARLEFDVKLPGGSPEGEKAASGNLPDLARTTSTPGLLEAGAVAGIIGPVLLFCGCLFLSCTGEAHW